MLEIQVMSVVIPFLITMILAIWDGFGSYPLGMRTFIKGQKLVMKWLLFRQTEIVDLSKVDKLRLKSKFGNKLFFFERRVSITGGMQPVIQAHIKGKWTTIAILCLFKLSRHKALVRKIIKNNPNIDTDPGLKEFLNQRNFVKWYWHWGNLWRLLLVYGLFYLFLVY